MMFPNKKMAQIIPLVGDYRLAGGGVSVVTGACVVIEPQAQVIYQGVQQDDFTPLTVRACHNRRVMIFRRGWFTQRMAYRCSCHTNIRSELFHDPHSTEIEEDGSTISDDAGSNGVK